MTQEDIIVEIWSMIISIMIVFANHNELSNSPFLIKWWLNAFVFALFFYFIISDWYCFPFSTLQRSFFYKWWQSFFVRATRRYVHWSSGYGVIGVSKKVFGLGDPSDSRTINLITLSLLMTRRMYWSMRGYCKYWYARAYVDYSGKHTVGICTWCMPRMWWHYPWIVWSARMDSQQTTLMID